MGEIYGNTEGLKTNQQRWLDRIARRRVDPDLVISPELARELAAFSYETGRQAGVLINRAGGVDYVIVGDAKAIVIPVLPQSRSVVGRLKGLRCIHTHLGREALTEDDLMDLLFLRLDMMAAIAVSGDGLPERILAAHLLPQSLEGKDWVLLPPVVPSQQPQDFRDRIGALEEEFARLRPTREVEQGRDRAILISVTTEAKDKAFEEVAELAELARSADVLVLDTIVQRRHQINPKWILGKGKLGEVVLAALRLNANLLIFNQELNPSQIRSITDHVELRVIDRTQLILDIFARRALSREGKLQIEMAQLKYMLPRLTLRDDALSRLTGGIGARGPGETRLEVDRRRIGDRLAKLTDKLKEVGKERHYRRSRRRKRDLPVLSLVGYTNAGKTTLLNSLTKSTVLAEDKLFATLDPTSRRLKFPQDMEVIITDTVGFIRNLPAELLLAFKATLEELHEADVLIHVIDASNPRFAEQMAVVDGLLEELELDTIPRLLVFNKTDRLAAGEAENLCQLHGAVALAAVDPTTFAPFLVKARQMVLAKWGRG